MTSNQTLSMGVFLKFFLNKLVSLLRLRFEFKTSHKHIHHLYKRIPGFYHLPCGAKYTNHDPDTKQCRFLKYCFVKLELNVKNYRKHKRRKTKATKIVAKHQRRTAIQMSYQLYKYHIRYTNVISAIQMSN